LWELYRQELDDHPDEAAGGRCTRLLHAPLRPGLLADVAECRWRVLVRGGSRWGMIQSDLEHLRPRFVREEEETWVRLLFSLADELAWGDSPAVTVADGELTDDALSPGLALFEVCLKEIRGYDYLAPRLSQAFDRLDFLIEVSRGWRLLRERQAVPEVFLELVPWTWTGPFADVRPRLLRLLHYISAAPRQWLGHMDAVHGQASAVLGQFGRTLYELAERMEWQPVRERNWEWVARLAVDFVDAQGQVSYQCYRPQFLEFCLREAVDPGHVASVFAQRPADWPAAGVSLGQAMAGDWPLRYVYLACQLFWA
jgi:hypothetical protein